MTASRSSAVVAVVGDVDGVALAPQAPGHGVGQVDLVVDHQQPHGGDGTAEAPAGRRRRPVRIGRRPTLAFVTACRPQAPTRRGPHRADDHVADRRPATPAEAALLEQALFEVKKVIVGQDRAIERLLVCLLARGHCLLEGVPGLAKTLAVRDPGRRSSAARSPASSSRPTCCPPTSSAPASTGRRTETFDVELGPVFANFVLADEINRAPAKVQSALLEVMAEHQVSIGGTDLPGAPTRSSCSPPRTRSSPRASTRCPRPSATASS